MTRPRPVLTLEFLERRELPATFGVPWPDADELTLRFIPDGTLIAGQPSELFRTLDAQLPTAGWQREILRAFQTWAVTSHINVTVVTEGESAGESAPGPHKPADIRVAALPLSANTLAIAAPYDPSAGEFAGDVLLNSNYKFGAGNTDTYDLYSVFLHEAGHVFGIEGHADAPEEAVMNQEYEGIRTGLSPWDLNAIQNLYRARPQDEYDGRGGSQNETFVTATSISVGSETCDGQKSAVKPSASTSDRSTTDKKPQADSSSPEKDGKSSLGVFGFGGQSKPPSKSAGSTDDTKSSTNGFGFGGDRKPLDRSANQAGDGKSPQAFLGPGSDHKSQDSFSSRASAGTSAPTASGQEGDKKSHGYAFNQSGNHFTHTDFSSFLGNKKVPDKAGNQQGKDKLPSGSFEFGSQPKPQGGAPGSTTESKPPSGSIGLGGDRKPQDKSATPTSGDQSKHGFSGLTGDKKSTDSSPSPSSNGKSSSSFFGFGSGKKPNSCGSTLEKGDPLAEIKGELTTATDVDVYRFDIQRSVAEATVRLQTSADGLLTPRLTVYNANRQVVDSVFTEHPLHEDLVISLGKVEKGTTFYIAVEGATNDVFNVGPYHLNIEDGKTPSTRLQSRNSSTAFSWSRSSFSPSSRSRDTAEDLPASSLHKNDDFDTAFALSNRSSNRHVRRTFDWISDPTDVDFFTVRAPTATKGKVNALRATVVRFRDDSPSLEIAVYDANRQIVPAEVITSEGGVYTILTTPVVADATYYVAVRPSQAQRITGRLNYSLTVTFDANGKPLDTFVTGTLSAAGRQDSQFLQVDQSEIFHLVLSADSAQAKVDVGLSLTVLDQDGHTVLRMTTRNGESTSLTTLLSAGTYTLLVAADVPDGTRLPPVFWELRGGRVSSPIGPRPEDTTLDAVSGLKAGENTPAKAVTSETGNRAFLTVQAPASDLGWEGHGPPTQRTVQQAAPAPELPGLAPVVLPPGEAVARRVEALLPPDMPVETVEVAVPATDAPAELLEMTVPESFTRPPLIVAQWATMTRKPEFEEAHANATSEATRGSQAVTTPSLAEGPLSGVLMLVRIAAYWAQLGNRATVSVPASSRDLSEAGESPEATQSVNTAGRAETAPSVPLSMGFAAGTTPVSWNPRVQPPTTTLLPERVQTATATLQQSAGTAMPSTPGTEGAERMEHGEGLAPNRFKPTDSADFVSTAELVTAVFSSGTLEETLDNATPAQPGDDLASQASPSLERNALTSELPWLAMVLMLGQLPMWVGAGYSPFGMRPGLKQRTSQKAADAA